MREIEKYFRFLKISVAKNSKHCKLKIVEGMKPSRRKEKHDYMISKALMIVGFTVHVILMII